MTRKLPVTAFLTLCFVASIWAQQSKIDGVVVDTYGRPVAHVRVSSPGGQAVITDSKGQFSILHSQGPGQPVGLMVIRSGWAVLEPQRGEVFTQDIAKAFSPVRVKIALKGSNLFLSDVKLSYLADKLPVEYAKERSQRLALERAVKLERKTIGQLRGELVQFAPIRDYAKDTGLTARQVVTALLKWAQLSKVTDDQLTRIRKSYILGNYDEVIRLTNAVVPVNEQLVSQRNEEALKEQRKLISTYRFQGSSYDEKGEYRAALLSYSEIEQRVANNQLWVERLREELADVDILVGNAKAQLGLQVGGDEGPRLLGEAVASYKKAITVYTREVSLQNWAMTQNNLGNVLFDLGERTAGAAGAKYLQEAEKACRAALEVYTPEAFKQDRAGTQNNLGTVLSMLGERTEGAARVKYLQEAKQAYRAALEVYTREALPQNWAGTTDNLGNVLSMLGERTEGAAGVKYLQEAEKVYRAALTVYTYPALPQQWAMVQNNLGIVLSALGGEMEGTAGAKYLQEAEKAYRAALTVYTRDVLPHQWAAAQKNLGIVLGALGGRTENLTSLWYLQGAVKAYRASMLVDTRELMPQAWAIRQVVIGETLRTLAGKSEGVGKVNYLKEAVVAYQEALKVFTLEADSQRWKLLQEFLADSYLKLEDAVSAAGAYANVLQVEPDNKDAYSEASRLYHEVLYDYAAAFALHQKWLAGHKDDAAVLPYFAETHFTTGRFAECVTRVNALVGSAYVKPSTKIALRAIELGALLAQGHGEAARGKLDALIAEVKAQPLEFKAAWSFNGTRHFIEQEEKLAAQRAWLLRLFDALGSPDRDVMLAALREVQAHFNH